MHRSLPGLFLREIRSYCRVFHAVVKGRPIRWVPMSATITDEGFDLNFLDAMLLHMLPQE